MPADPAPSSATAAMSSTDLAMMRTGLASERTLMAWVRTSLSMISFGFTIYKVLQAAQQIEHQHSYTPRAAGLMLIGLGVLSMILGTVEYSANQKRLNLPIEISLRRPTFVIALILMIGGTALFASVIIKLF